MNSQELIKRK